MGQALSRVRLGLFSQVRAMGVRVGFRSRTGNNVGCSANTNGLSLGLDHDHDALLPLRVGRTGVLRGQLVGNLPRRIALEPFDDLPTDDNGLERVVNGRDG